MARFLKLLILFSLLREKRNGKLKKWPRPITLVIAGVTDGRLSVIRSVSVLFCSVQSVHSGVASYPASSTLYIALLTQGNPISNLELDTAVCICLAFVQGVSKLNDERERTTARNSFRSRVHLWKWREALSVPLPPNSAHSQCLETPLSYFFTSALSTCSSVMTQFSRLSLIRSCMYIYVRTVCIAWVMFTHVPHIHTYIRYGYSLTYVAAANSRATNLPC